MAPISGHEKQVRGATDVWLTPLPLIKGLGDFDLDPCGYPCHPTAKEIYLDNGLVRPWHGRVWLNPPYSEVGKWLDKMVEHNNGVALVFARLDTKWAQKILPKAQRVFFPAGRIKFMDLNFQYKWSAGAPSMFLSFGEHTKWSIPGWEAK